MYSMARLIRDSEKRVYAVARHQVNGTVFAQGFSDTIDGDSVTENADQKAAAFLRLNPGSKIAPDALMAEQAIEWALKIGL